MKTILKSILLGLTILTLNSVSAQTIIATRTASLVSGDYATSGTVHLELYDDNSLDLRFESDYLTQPNVFDVHVFLTNSTNYASPIDTTGFLLVENIGTISGLNYSSGAMTFNLPSGTSIDDFDHIVFICIQYGQLHWANGVFSVTTTGIETISNPSTKIYPTTSLTGCYTLTIGNNFNDGKIVVSDINGRTVLEKQIQGENSIPLNINGDKGTYIIRIISDNEQEIIRAVKL